MSFLRPIQWYHSQADQIWPDGTFKLFLARESLADDIPAGDEKITNFFYSAGEVRQVTLMLAVFNGRAPDKGQLLVW